MTADRFREHLQYNEWAGKRIVEAAALLAPEEFNRDFGTAHSSVSGTLGHLFSTDRLWLARLQQAPSPDPAIREEDRAIENMVHQWPELWAKWNVWAEGLSDAKLEEAVPYRDMKGAAWQQPLWQLLLHIVNHGTHHRGQVAGFLRSMGHAPPVLDLVALQRLRMQNT